MSTREELKERARTLQEGGRGILCCPAFVRWAEYLIRALLSGMLAGAEIFGGFAPFALGMTAASGAGAAGFSSLVGACFGYLIFRGFVDGLPYAAACILTFAVAFAFCDIKFCTESWFMPTIAVLFAGVTGFVHRTDLTENMTQVIYFATELMLVAATAYFYRVALSHWEKKDGDAPLNSRQLISVFILICTLLIAMAEVRIGETISLGCITGGLLCMLAAWKGGAGFAAASGVCIGLAMDLSMGQAPQYTMAYAFAGVLSGVFRKHGKLLTVLTYVLANGAVVLWMWKHSCDLTILYEVFIASVLFMLLPETVIQRTAASLSTSRPEIKGAVDGTRTYAMEKLAYTADAFQEIYDSLRTSFRRVAPNDADVSGVFHRAANRVCVLCALRDYCWQREYAATMNALNDGLPAMSKRGRGQAEDFPLHFRTRCLNFSALLAAANEELTALRYRRQFQSRAREGREAVCRQYGLFARVLEDTLRKFSQPQVRDVRREKRVHQRLAALGIEADGGVWYDTNGHLLLELTGQGLDPLKQEEERRRLARLLGVELSRPEERIQDGTVSLRWRQAEPLMAVAGLSAREKDGQTVSGDAGAWFKTDDGNLYVLLCDGMGSGTQARRESTLAIRLLEKFIRAGMEPDDALNTLNSALALREEKEIGFTTVDLFRLDLFTGEAGFYKLGAAPTYVRHKGTVNRVTGMSMPAGLNGNDAGADVCKMRLEAGDSVVMISDGVASAQDDGWVKSALAVYGGKDPKSLAAELIEKGTEYEGSTDDRTAVVLTIKART